MGNALKDFITCAKNCNLGLAFSILKYDINYEKIMKLQPHTKNKVLPVVVSEVEDLFDAAKNNKKVIIVNNTNLFEAIKKNVDKDANFNKRAAWITGTGAVLLAVAFLTPLTAALEMPIVASACIGQFCIMGGGGASLISQIKGKFKDYAWEESEDNKILILTKVKGKNKFDDSNDAIDFSELKKG